jgi:hypothetical protein
MSAQIDIISERSELGQGSWVRLEEIGRASTVTLDDRYRFAARSVNLTWPLCGKMLAASICRRSEKSFSSFLLLACDGFGDVPREAGSFFPFSARTLLEISAVDTQIITTLYKKVIIFLNRGRAFCDFGLLIVG